jgi:hypothetical protein
MQQNREWKSDIYSANEWMDPRLLRNANERWLPFSQHSSTGTWATWIHAFWYYDRKVLFHVILSSSSVPHSWSPHFMFPNVWISRLFHAFYNTLQSYYFIIEWNVIFKLLISLCNFFTLLSLPLSYFQGRPLWLMVSVIAVGHKNRGFKPGIGGWIFKMDKNP